MTDVERIEFGDFQTPPALASQVVELLRSRGLTPRTIVEPNCGLGAFVEASLEAFPTASILAVDINPDYVSKTTGLRRLTSAQGRLTCRVANFFSEDWKDTLGSLPRPLLIVGNPPWVTASGLGALGSTNAPQKSNFQQRRGLDAVTGKSNFDVAEWMLLKLLDAAAPGPNTLAMLVKTSVARRVLAHLWGTGAPVKGAAIFRFDAAAHFGVSADACLFLCEMGQRSAAECALADLECPDVVAGRIGWRDGTLVSDPIAYDQNRSLLACPSERQGNRWRSGVKHDCAVVMEFERAADGRFINGHGDCVELEPEYVYPLLKSTDLAHGRHAAARKWLLVTQGRPGEDTSVIARRAPRTWAYLHTHGDQLDGRRSSIYRNKPRFSIFGVGPYTFAPWKVAISGLHKRLDFNVVGPIENRPVVFDDTCYHLSFDTKDSAVLAADLLNSTNSRAFLAAMVFWDSKRPITVDTLQRLDLRKVAKSLGTADPLGFGVAGADRVSHQPSLAF
jgi:hypothetical protein